MKQFSLFLVIALLLTLCGCGSAGETDSVETVASTPQETAATEAPPEPVPSEEVENPTLPEAETEPEQSAPPVLHSGLQGDGTFGSGVLFIGDSQTCIFAEQHLKALGLIGGAKIAAQCGASVNTFWDDTVRPSLDKSVFSSFSPEFEGMTFREAVTSVGPDAIAIYLMLGSNFVADCGSEGYIAIVDWLLETCPNATVHLQTIPYGQTAYVTVNTWLQETLDHYHVQGETRVFLIDTYTFIGKSIGSDGVHVTANSCVHWYDAIVSHAEENDLLP